MDRPSLEEIKAGAIRDGNLEPAAAEILQPELRSPAKYTGSPTWGTVANLASTDSEEKA
jgi:hypothetical protein